MAKGIKYYSLREVKRQGKRDGRDWQWKPWRPFPGWPLWETKEPDPPVAQKEPSQYESKLISIAHENLERIANDWAKEDEKLTEEYCNAKDKKEALESKIAKEYKEHKEAIENYEKAKRAFSEFPPRWIPLGVYWLIFGLVILGEGLFNYYVFQLFGQTPTETFLMAGAIIVTVAFCSEVIGHNLKREKKEALARFLNGLMVAVVAIVLVGIAILRETFLEATRTTGIFNIPLNPVIATIIFITFNLAFFIGLTYLSYTEARTNPEAYRKAKKAYKDALKNLKKEGEDVEKLAEELAEAVERFNKAHSAREHTFETYKHRSEEERDIWVSYVRAYRHANMSARRDKTLPESFKVDPETLIKIPDVFKTLDWSCP